ncbi:MAG: fasciclin domain-containing protein, partial [Anaerolineae bacterium]|nr:fasciclin domain-containing protein [Anaerolineae bacterium]
VPTEEPTATSEPTATDVPTEEPTATSEPTATDVPTEEPTVVVEATAEATEAVAEATEVVATEVAIEATEEAAQPLTVAEIAAQGDEFTILLQAVEAAGLTEALSGSGPLTVFAPTDAAFEALLETLEITSEELLEREDLTAILLYHVVGGAVPADTLLTLLARQDDGALDVQSLLEDQALVFTTAEDGSIVINGSAKVVVADVRASNGVVHVIDTVLLPAAAE